MLFGRGTFEILLGFLPALPAQLVQSQKVTVETQHQDFGRGTMPECFDTFEANESSVFGAHGPRGSAARVWVFRKVPWLVSALAFVCVTYACFLFSPELSPL